MNSKKKLIVGKNAVIALLIVSLALNFWIDPSFDGYKQKNCEEYAYQTLQNSQDHNFTSRFSFNLTDVEHVKNYDFILNNTSRIRVLGEFMFVLYQTTNLAIFNISTPKSPWYRISYDFGVPISNFIIDGNIMYLATPNSIVVYNISDVVSISSIASYSWFSEIIDFYIEGENLYILDYTSGTTYLRIFTNRMWNSVDEVGQIPLGTGYYRDVIKVNNAIIAGANTGMIIAINVENPSFPNVIDSKNYASSVSKLKMYGNELYFADLNNFHEVKSTNFDDLASYPLGTISNYVLEGNIAYFALNSGIIKIINTTRSDRYEAIADLNVGAPINDLVIYDNYMIFATPNKLYSVQVAAEIIPNQMLLENPNDTYQARIFGEYAFIATSSELRIFNIRNNSYVNSYNYLGLGVRDVFLHGRYLYILYYSDLLRIVNFEDPLSLTYQNQTTLGAHSTNSMTYSAGYLFISRLSQGVTILNISNPTSADVIATIPTTSSSYSSIVMNDLLYIANYDYLSVVNISDISNPVEIRTITSLNVFSLELSFPYLYLGTQTGLRIYNISESNPIFIAQHNIIGLNSQSLKKSGDLLYCARGTGGLQVLNVTNPQIKNSFYENDSLTGISVDITHNKAILSRNTNGWEILKIRNTAVDIILGKYFIETLWSTVTNGTTENNDQKPDDSPNNENTLPNLNWGEILSFSLPALGIVIVIYLIIKIRGSKGPKAKKIKAMTTKQWIQVQNRVLMTFSTLIFNLLFFRFFSSGSKAFNIRILKQKK